MFYHVYRYFSRECIILQLDMLDCLSCTTVLFDVLILML